MNMTMDLTPTQKVELHTTLCRRCHAPQRLNDAELCQFCDQLPAHITATPQDAFWVEARVLAIVLFIMFALMVFGWGVNKIAEVLG